MDVLNNHNRGPCAECGVDVVEEYPMWLRMVDSSLKPIHYPACLQKRQSADPNRIAAQVINKCIETVLQDLKEKTEKGA